MPATRRPLAATSVRDALDSAVIPLTAAGCESPRLDAEVLLAHVIGTDRTALFAHPGRELDGAQARAFMDAVRRRREREPVAYITGRKGFRALELDVDRRVLIPRPETEHLVEAALGLPEGARVADVGTGSGAVALALKHERPDLDVIATDASGDALAVARANAGRLGLEVAFAEGDLLAPVDGPLDAVVSNPPYVAEADRLRLMPEVSRWEPGAALFAGADGLDVIRRLVPQAGERGAVFVALEVGLGQADAVRALLADAGYPETGAERDLAGIERVAWARR